VVDQLAVEYADRPVIFLEDNVDTPLGCRRDRWWAGYGSGGSVYLPLVMASSGHRLSAGSVNFLTVYGGIVDAELARPPQAEVEAYAARVGNAMRIWVRLVNGSTATLSAAANGATAHAIVWEEKKVHVTSRTVRAAPFVEVAPGVAPGAVFTAVLDTPALSGVDWSKLHAVALVDYRPTGATGAYDMLQAALAVPPELGVTPDDLAATSGDLAPDGTLGAVALGGPHVLTWSAASSAFWLTVTPGAGAVPGAATVRVVREALPSGVSEGTLTFTATGPDGLAFTRQVNVRVDAPDTGKRVRRRLLRSLPGA
jgi:hypothetical protein